MEFEKIYQQSLKENTFDDLSTLYSFLIERLSREDYEQAKELIQKLPLKLSE